MTDEVTFEQLISTVDREIGLREKHYPRWVAQKKLLQSAADTELLRMKAVRENIIVKQALYNTFMRLLGEGVVHMKSERIEAIMEEEDAACRLKVYEAGNG